MEGIDSRRRLRRAALAGLLVGAVALSLFLAPSTIAQYLDRRAEEVRQHSLIPARGEAFEDVRTATVSLSVLLDGMPQGDMAASAGGCDWYTPVEGHLALSLAPMEHTFRATYDNRMVQATYQVKENAANEVALDIGHAPSAPELLIFELGKGESRAFDLGISGATEIRLDGVPNGVSVVRQGEDFMLSVDGELTEYGFFTFYLRAQNERGEATTCVGLRIPRETDPIEIRTVEDLERIRENLSGHFVLACDLDMSDVLDWAPIGNDNYPFTGVFDGAGHEITGFHSPDQLIEGARFSFFWVARRAEIRNVIFREPDIAPSDVETESSICAVIVMNMEQGLMEHCAVIGGAVAPAKGGAAGLVGGGSGILRGCFNSADVLCVSVNAPMSLQNVGGIAGAFSGYGVMLANEGEVVGTHVTGGIVGLSYDGVLLRRCVNSGFIWGSVLVGEFPPGGIVHPGFSGGVNVGYCYFVRGQSALGGKGCAANAVEPISWDELRTPGALVNLGSFDGEQPDWAYASLDAVGPMPYGIFTRRSETPELPDVGDRVVLPPSDGLTYFYTLDGSDPRASSAHNALSLDVSLSAGQVLLVYTARRGCYDSEVFQYQPTGGEMG